MHDEDRYGAFGVWLTIVVLSMLCAAIAVVFGGLSFGSRESDFGVHVGILLKLEQFQIPLSFTRYPWLAHFLAAMVAPIFGILGSLSFLTIFSCLIILLFSCYLSGQWFRRIAAVLTFFAISLPLISGMIERGFFSQVFSLGLWLLPISFIAVCKLEKFSNDKGEPTHLMKTGFFGLLIICLFMLIYPDGVMWCAIPICLHIAKPPRRLLLSKLIMAAGIFLAIFVLFFQIKNIEIKGFAHGTMKPYFAFLGVVFILAIMNQKVWSHTIFRVIFIFSIVSLLVAMWSYARLERYEYFSRKNAYWIASFSPFLWCVPWKRLSDYLLVMAFCIYSLVSVDTLVEGSKRVVMQAFMSPSAIENDDISQIRILDGTSQEMKCASSIVFPSVQKQGITYTFGEFLQRGMAYDAGFRNRGVIDSLNPIDRSWAPGELGVERRILKERQIDLSYVIEKVDCVFVSGNIQVSNGGQFKTLTMPPTKDQFVFLKRDKPE